MEDEVKNKDKKHRCWEELKMASLHSPHHLRPPCAAPQRVRTSGPPGDLGGLGRFSRGFQEKGRIF